MRDIDYRRFHGEQPHLRPGELRNYALHRRATPNVVPAGAMILQPNEERRRSGSFYTPRSLTEPIVRTTLRPIFERLGAKPWLERIDALERAVTV